MTNLDYEIFQDMVKSGEIETEYPTTITPRENEDPWYMVTLTRIGSTLGGNNPDAEDCGEAKVVIGNEADIAKFAKNGGWDIIETEEW